jgi:hypothetical protein
MEEQGREETLERGSQGLLYTGEGDEVEDVYRSKRVEEIDIPGI